MSAPSPVGEMRFHSIQVYAKSLKELQAYKDEEKTYNKFQQDAQNEADCEKGQKMYCDTFGTTEIPTFVSQGQDLVHQLISGLGFRVVGWHEGADTRSALVRSSDERGVKFIVTAPQDTPAAKKRKATTPDHFKKSKLENFMNQHPGLDKAGKGGVGVLCFEMQNGVATVKANYEKKHPALLVSDHSYDGGYRVVEVYAYYLPNSKEPDTGTTLRFVERKNDALMPGFDAVDASFAVPCEAYFDHWVSNVVDRKGFIQTMTDTLGFTPKVDFNAGVVAAGEAIIESTVIGNTPPKKVMSKAEILVDQSQIYLPINNALSEVGHVHLYIEELGQGIQHIASRVKDLVAFISRTNKFRSMTGNGLSFLNIPRSYYGRLDERDLAKIDGLDAGCVDALYTALLSAKVIDSTGVVPLDITHAQIAAAKTSLSTALQATMQTHLDAISTMVLRARYNNLVKLLGDHFSENTYLEIVRNKILVDIQENDVLYQIFTTNVLQDNKGEESPFLEFIQRVCSEKKDSDGNPLPIRPGCGGFGIRNFLTLFLSIEVHKAMNNIAAAEKSGDAKAKKLAEEQVRTLTMQLDESNPILTTISDAMTAQADAITKGDTAEAAKWEAKKGAAQKELQECSNKYKALMKTLRQQ